MQKTSFTYRPDIDGLRAIAVLAVVFFHLGISGFKGGFVGVDVFFVISGYLIFSIISSEVQRGEFSASSFFTRRSRRLFPAYAVVLIFTTVGSWIFIFQYDFREFGQSLFSAALFMSDIFYFREMGYFSISSERMPLLHTWSLSVEIKFYIFFGFIYAVFALSKHIFKLLLALIAVQLLLCVYVSYWVSRDAAFYIFLFRGWEFVIGSFVAWLALNKTKDYTPTWKYHSAGVSGIALIAASIVFLDKQYVFPGALAIAPCLGTALLIWAGDGPASLLQRGLRSSPMVAIGKISYPLYLWHWPIFVLLNYVDLYDGTFFDNFLIIFLSFALSFLTYRYVEIPMRKSGFRMAWKGKVHVTTFALLVLSAVGFAIHLGNGFPNRMDANVTRFAEGAFDRPNRNTMCTPAVLGGEVLDGICRLSSKKYESPKSILLWGNSHAEHFLPTLQKLSEEFKTDIYYNKVSCRTFDPSVSPQRCQSPVRSAMEMLKHGRITDVLLADAWIMATEGSEAGALKHGQEPTLEEKEDLKRKFKEQIGLTLDNLGRFNVSISVIYQVPTYAFNVPNRLSLYETFGLNIDEVGRSEHSHTERHSYVTDTFNHENRISRSIDPALLLCANKAFCMTNMNGKALYYDDVHLSKNGALYVYPEFEKWMNDIGQ